MQRRRGPRKNAKLARATRSRRATQQQRRSAYPRPATNTLPLRSARTLLDDVRDAWRTVQIADEQLVHAIAEAHDVDGHTYRRMADFIVEPTGEPALTNERRRRLANTLKERLGRARRATK